MVTFFCSVILRLEVNIFLHNIISLIFFVKTEHWGTVEFLIITVVILRKAYYFILFISNIGTPMNVSEANGISHFCVF